MSVSESYNHRYSASKHNDDNNIKKIYLLRHGETEWNKAGLGQGQEADIPMNDTGREQTRKTGEYLKKYRMSDGDFDCIYASPMLRAKETAEIIKKIIGFDEDIIYDDRLKEKKHGLISGKPSSDPLIKDYKTCIKKVSPIDPIERYNSFDIVKQHINDKLNIGLELDIDAEDRAEKVIKKIIKTECKKILIVAHGGILLAMIRRIFRIPRSPLGGFENGENCWLSYITYDDKHKFTMISPINTEHLSLV